MDELVKALRYCAEASNEMGCSECTVDRTVDCVGKLMRDAADAIEQLQVDNADLENRIGHQNVTIAELYKMIEKLTKENQTK